MNTKTNAKYIEISADFPNNKATMKTTKTTEKEKSGRTSGYELWKNIFDRVLALMFLVTLSPLFAFIAIVIKLDSRGKIIFCREQVGKNGKNFIMYKFRTMIADNDDKEYKSYLKKYINEGTPYTTDENGQPIYKVVNDPRVTRFGVWLRKSNMDELPQFFNVLKGDMSLVGPRPDVPFAVDMYQEWHRERLNIKPGLMGLWQVGNRKSASFEEMVCLDIEYIKKQSLILDVKIIMKTIITILRGDGS
jgi:lipopolysaccharide/colanic/teichoic acid biosynthesis glycosyltransferase